MISAIFGTLTTGSTGETVAETLERGVQLQQNDGDLDEAIRSFEAGVRQESKWRKHAAEACFRPGDRLPLGRSGGC
jgi:hypothetical protein